MPKLKKWNVPFVVKGTISVTSVDRPSAVSIVQQMEIDDLVRKCPNTEVRIDPRQIEFECDVIEPEKQENIFIRIWRRLVR